MSRSSNLITNDLEYLRNTQMPRSGPARQEYLSVFQRVLADATGMEVTTNGNLNSRDSRAAIQGLGLSGNPRGLTPEVLEAVVARAERVANGQAPAAAQQPATDGLARAQEAAREAAAPIVRRPQSAVEGTLADLRTQQGVQRLTASYGDQQNLTAAMQANLHVISRAVESGNAIGDTGRNARPDSPETVTALQNTLIALGHSGRVRLPEGFTATGIMNDATRDAVRDIQRNYGERGARVDGIVGSSTMTTLTQLSFDVNNQMLRIGDRQPAQPAAAPQGPEWEPLRYGNHPSRAPIMVMMPDGSQQPIMRRTRDGAPGSNEFQHDIRLPEGFDRTNMYSRRGILEALAQTDVNRGRDPGARNILLGGVDATPSNLETPRPARSGPNGMGDHILTPPDPLIGARRPHQLSAGYQNAPMHRANSEGEPTRHRDGSLAVREGDGHNQMQVRNPNGGGVIEGPAQRTRVVNFDGIVDSLISGNNIISAGAVQSAGAARQGGGIDGTARVAQMLQNAGVSFSAGAVPDEAAIGALVASRAQGVARAPGGGGDGGGPGGSSPGSPGGPGGGGGGAAR